MEQAKYWSFRDWFGVEVWQEPYNEGDTPEGMMQYWDEFIADEEYDPCVEELVLVDVKEVCWSR